MRQSGETVVRVDFVIMLNQIFAMAAAIYGAVRVGIVLLLFRSYTAVRINHEERQRI